MLKNTKKVNAHISHFSDGHVFRYKDRWTRFDWKQMNADISLRITKKKQQNQSTKNILNEKETGELTICGVGRSCSKSFK